MKKRATIWVGLLATLGTLSATACSGGTPELSNAEDFIYTAVIEDLRVPVKDREDAIKLGHTICAWFDEGASLMEIGVTLMDTRGWTPTQAGHVIGAATGVYCPHHNMSSGTRESGVLA